MLKNDKKNVGRNTVMTNEVIGKLEDAFMFTYSDKEACLYAGISEDALYDYQKKNPQFTKRKHILRLTPNLAAKKELVSGIKGNIGQARWWAERKIPNEFGEKTTIKHEGEIGIDSEEITEGLDKAVKLFNESMRSVLTKKKK